MGSPPGYVPANVLMCEFEENFTSSCQKIYKWGSATFWHWHVNDVLSY